MIVFKNKTSADDIVTYSDNRSIGYYIRLTKTEWQSSTEELAEILKRKYECATHSIYDLIETVKVKCKEV